MSFADEDNEYLRANHLALGNPPIKPRPAGPHTSQKTVLDMARECLSPTPFDPERGTPKADHRQHRKDRPIARGVLAYFPDALAEVANVSRVANEQHNPGEPMHWAFGKSMDHADCIMRHLVDAGTIDEDDGLEHTAKVAWRALALLQTELETRDAKLHARRQAQRDLAAGKSGTDAP